MTFANLNGSETCPDGVIVLEEDVGESEEGASSVSKKTRCVIDKSIFEVHQKYKDLGADMHAFEQNGIILLYHIQWNLAMADTIGTTI